MRIRLSGLLAVAMLPLLAAPIVAADEPAPMPRVVVSCVYQLRNTAAAEVADAVQKFLVGQHEKAVVVAEPASNTILVSAESELHGRVVKLLTALDAAPPKVQIELTVMRVPCGFLADIGLADVASENAITITPRELSMFTAAIRKEMSNGTIDILSRPQILVSDNQTGQIRVGGEDVMPSGMEIVDGPTGPVLSMKKQKVETGLHLAVTPRTAPVGKPIMLRVKTSSTEVADFAVMTQFTVPPEITGLKEPIRIPIGNRAVNVQTWQMTVEMKDGETVIMRGPASEKDVGDKKRANGSKSELLILLTPHCVRTPATAVQPAAHSEATPRPVPLLVPSLGVVTIPQSNPK